MTAASPDHGDSSAAPEGAPTWWVVCLCAEWCNVCRAIHPEFDALAARSPGVAFTWVDVEDEEQLVGDLDIETFPTVLIGSAHELRFFGAIQPQAAVLARMVDGLTGDGGAPVFDPQALALLARIIASRS
ncbi:MAG: thioredoxin [Burkholderiales bacterium]|nr:thioredoxin [Burkholderiales bacterium]